MTKHTIHRINNRDGKLGGALSDSDTNIMNLLNNDIGSIGKSLSNLLYLFDFSERKAFLSQMVNELEELNANSINYKEKMKETTIYKNITGVYGKFSEQINSITDEELKRLNFIINANKNGKTHVPLIPINAFNAEIFKDKLKKFAENIYYWYIKHIGSVTMYYLMYHNGGHMVRKTDGQFSKNNDLI